MQIKMLLIAVNYGRSEINVNRRNNRLAAQLKIPICIFIVLSHLFPFAPLSGPMTPQCISK